jgi:hypothetical protein
MLSILPPLPAWGYLLWEYLTGRLGCWRRRLLIGVPGPFSPRKDVEAAVEAKDEHGGAPGQDAQRAQQPHGAHRPAARRHAGQSQSLG